MGILIADLVGVFCTICNIDDVGVKRAYIYCLDNAGKVCQLLFSDDCTMLNNRFSSTFH